jgi:hypothetical protein
LSWGRLLESRLFETQPIELYLIELCAVSIAIAQIATFTLWVSGLFKMFLLFLPELSILQQKNTPTQRIVIFYANCSRKFEKFFKES